MTPWVNSLFFKSWCDPVRIPMSIQPPILTSYPRTSYAWYNLPQSPQPTSIIIRHLRVLYSHFLTSDAMRDSLGTYPRGFKLNDAFVRADQGDLIHGVQNCGTKCKVVACSVSAIPVSAELNPSIALQSVMRTCCSRVARRAGNSQ
jgi:hypothetical protein